jgi:hypothetical protein
MIGNFPTSKSLNVGEREYSCLCSYYVINTYASLMYELKKIGKLFTSKFVGPRALVLYKNYLPDRGLTKVGKHWSRQSSETQLLNPSASHSERKRRLRYVLTQFVNS